MKELDFRLPLLAPRQNERVTREEGEAKKETNPPTQLLTLLWIRYPKPPLLVLENMGGTPHR